MKTLIIDTSTEKSVVIFSEANQVLFANTFFGGHSSRLLFPTIEAGLSTLNISLDEIEAIGVGIGPGSFTGIRLGVSAAQGFAFKKSLPVVGFYSLSGFISSKEGKFLSVIDANVNGVYVLPQEKKGKEIFELGEPKFISIDQFNTEQTLYSEIVGPTFKRLPIKGKETNPDPNHLAALIEKALKRPINPLKIFYLNNSK